MGSNPTECIAKADILPTPSWCDPQTGPGRHWEIRGQSSRYLIQDGRMGQAAHSNLAGLLLEGGTERRRRTRRPACCAAGRFPARSRGRSLPYLLVIAGDVVLDGRSTIRLVVQPIEVRRVAQHAQGHNGKGEHRGTRFEMASESLVLV